MIPETLREILRDEGMVAIGTQGEKGPHIVNTWNSYVTITEEEHFLIPAGRMHATEANLQRDPRVVVTMGSRNVPGLRGVGSGFFIEATAKMESSGAQFDSMKKRFNWMRALLIIKPETFTQTL